MTEIRRATLDDLKVIDSLRRKEAEAVGFIPDSRWELELSGAYNGAIWLLEENADPVGYLYATFSPGRGRIQQVVVREDARRAERATALVTSAEAESAKRGAFDFGCRVGLDLEATAFWEAMGFEQVATIPGGQRRNRTLGVYRKAIGTERLL